MLTALAVTLLLMAAVVTVFANVTSSVTRRRATLEMSGQLRSVREQLSRDLEGATCTALPWREPEANEGYIEIIEGPQTDLYPSVWLYNDEPNQSGAAVEAETYASGLYTKGVGTVPGIDLAVSSLPGSNLRADNQAADEPGRGRMVGSYALLPDDVPTDGRGLGDGDDILMLTVRNEQLPFVGRIPPRPALVNQIGPGRADTDDLSPGPYAEWGVEEYESPLAEVVWFAFENPPEREDAQTFAFGEPGYRTIYRRALLIAPMLDYQIRVGTGGNTLFAEPGVVRVLPGSIGSENWDLALACLVSFQERYDLSVRLERDLTLGRWVLRANSLGDLTKRENRFEHHGFAFANSQSDLGRVYPFNAVSRGAYNGSERIQFAHDPELFETANTTQPRFEAVVTQSTPSGPDQLVGVEPDIMTTTDDLLSDANRRAVRPLAFVRQAAPDGRPAAVRAVLNEDGAIVAVTLGMSPLSGERRGDDVMMTDALGFDLRVYDPGAPAYAFYPGGVPADLTEADPPARVVQPGDAAWTYCYGEDATNDEWSENGRSTIGTLNTAGADVALPGAARTATGGVPFSFQAVGAYVDLNFGRFFNDVEDSEGVRGFADHANPEGLDPQFVSRQLDEQLYSTQLGIEGSWFQRVGQIRSWNLSAGPPFLRRSLTPGFSIYDTWSVHYETNNEDEDGDGVPDEGTDGQDSPAVYLTDVDNDGDIDGGVIFTRNGADDLNERETRPPYDRPLRGIQVQLRVYERDSRQVRETVVRESFIPE
ncbi:MAG: hypothetical protein AAFV43_08910 [Planctomycetota bacterium]